jgi:hypothetical protein
MLWGIAIILGVLWALGLAYGYTLGGAIYVLLAGAIVAMFLGLRKWWAREA